MEKIQFTGESLVEILMWRAENQPDKPAFIFLEDGERETSGFVYKMLDERARAIASFLQSSFHNSLHGERALLIYESGPDYVDSFFGCLYSGIISVPLHPPGKNKSLSRISAIAKDSGAKIILSTEGIKIELEKDFADDPILKELEWITTDKISNSFAGDFKPAEIKPETLAYLQYTSGSTGTPKGVMVNHRNLIHNINIIDKSHPHNNESVMVTWLPIHHDMGLIYGMLLPFVCGYPCYYMTPQAFVQKPYRWLHAISKYKGTHNAAPNFAFELCVNKISPEQKKTLDLSSWTVAMNAAEPVRAETINRFVDYFKDCGFKLKYFSPGYGLAEGTLILSTTFKDDEPVMKRFDDSEIEKNNKAVEAKENDSNSKVHVGHSNSIEDTRIAIVNPVTLKECMEGEVGEVWSSGISIAQGYWQREDATKETFKAHIADTNEGPFLRTGDLGFIKDNELYITGRYKDLIIIRGQNHYPQDIEYTVEASHPALRLGCVAAFPVEAGGEEHLGIVQEVQKNFVKDFNAEEVFKAIRKSVSEEHDLQVYSITLIQPGTVPKTSSGKIQRKACHQGVEDGTLSVIASWKSGEISDHRSSDKEKKVSKKLKFAATKNNLRDWLVNRLSELMQIQKDTIDVNEPFASYGMDSLKAVQLSGDLEELLEKELPSALVYDYPSIEILSKYLAEVPIESSEIKISGAKEKVENEPIAIVGIGLRFPDANNVNEFWNNLINGKDSIKKIPDERWNKNQLKDSTITFGGFVDDVDKFDPVFFGISPREAIQIDPQQRFTLEVAWQALEDAGINPETLTGTNTGVFMGICTYDYSRFSSGKKELFDVYTGTGTSLSIAANRLSYYFDFRGPSVAIDTACSSSLVALHAACQSLRNEESGIALAGGVNLLLAPDWNVVFTEADMLAADGRCKTFDESADGYVRSEGCGIVVLKKLSDAIKDGDRIYSVIKGSAINQDGRSNGLTAPNGPSQEEVIKSALQNAGVKPNEINYLETHGTGTPLGDPIEVNSLVKVLTSERPEENICYIGSVKTNIGHLEAAAGIAGVIKTSLALFHKEIPKHLHYNKLNPEILIKDKPVKVADKNFKWDGKNRTAGVSSFGFGGTNAHVILSEAPEQVNTNSKTKPFNIFTLSAKNENVLKKYADDYINFLNTNAGFKLEDICFTANEGRASLNHRLAVVCNSVDELRNELIKFTDGRYSPKIFSNQIKINHLPKIAFLFPGQGAQFIGMGKELYDTNPLFRNTINKCDEILRNFLDKPLLEVLFYEKDEKLNPINETTYTQPALFAIEYALAKVWMSWGIKPSVMMGHSAGEYVAACLAGVFSLEDGLKLVTERGRLMQTMTGEGEMYTVFADESKVKNYINGFENLVSVASINSPQKTVISGDKNSLSKIISKIDADKIEFKKINVSIASHSPLMKSMIEEFRKVCDSVKYFSAEIPVVSNITGEIVTDKISNGDYWCDHILSTVRFSDGIKACVDYGCEFFIDLGPKPTSIQMGQETIQEKNIQWLPSIKYNFSIWETMLQGLASMYVNGVKVDWNNFDKDFAHKIISLPSYPFQRQRYWIEDSEGGNKAVSYFVHDETDHPLLGKKLITASANEFIFNSQISATHPVYLKDHVVFDKIVLPGAAYAEIALAGHQQLEKNISSRIEDLTFHKVLVLESDEVKNIQTIFYRTGPTVYEFKIFSLKDENDWTLHASGVLKNNDFDINELNDLNKLKRKFTNDISADDFYDEIKSTGVDYRSDFRAINKLSKKNNTAFSEIILSMNVSDKNYLLHPVLLDSSFQTSLALLNANEDLAFIPFGIEKIEFYERPGEKIFTNAELISFDKFSKTHSVDLKIFNKDGKLISVISNLKLKEVSKKEFAAASENIDNWFYESVWEEKDPDYSNDDLTLENYRKGIEELNSISAYFILKAFSKSGLKFVKGKKFDSEKVFTDLKILPKYKKLFGRLVEILSENKIINKSGDEFEINVNFKETGSDNKTDSIKNNFPEVSPELTLLLRSGEKLFDVLTGDADPLQLLFPNGDLSDALRLYKESPGFIAMNNSIKTLVAEQINKLSPDKQIRILEIGAGTGSTTESVVAILSGMSYKYTFTDLSKVFFNKAKEKFKNYPNIEYKILDIEKDPIVQDFNAEEFDIIIASNVLHATKNLSESAGNALKLLKDNGILILNEVTQKQSWIDLTFGLTDGWWKFEDTKHRKDYPLMTPEDWKHFFTDSKSQSVLVNENSYTGQSIFLIRKEIVSTHLKHKHSVLFFEDSPDDLMKKFLKSSHLNYSLVVCGEKYEKISDHEFKINFTEKNNYEKFFKNISGKNTNLIYVSSEKDKVTAADKCMNVVNILKTALESNSVKPLSLNVITFNSQEVDNNPIDPVQSTLRGLVKVISIEHPEIRSKFIDTDHETSPEKIFAEVNSEDSENEIAFQKNKKYVSRLKRFDFAKKKEFKVDSNGTYLISGGTGGLGILTAKWLADTGARHIALIGRKGSTDKIKKHLKEIESNGVDVKIYKADVSDKDEMKKVFSELSKSKHRLKGVFHSAGVLDDAVLTNQTKQKFEKVFLPKVTGAWNLHELTKRMDLDIFVMYSSVASILGSAGQANHSAANSFLDSLAHFRRKNNLPAVSINWGLWSEIGSAAEKGADRKEKISGLKNIDPTAGINALKKVLTLNSAQVGIFPMDWEQYNTVFKNRSTEDLVKQITGSITKQEITSDKEDFITKLKNSPEGSHTKILVEYFQNLISRIMGLEPEDFEPEQPLNTMGLDSLMAIELKNKVNIELGVDLNLVRYVEETNIIQLAGELKEQLPNLLNQKKDGINKNGKEETEDEKARELITNLENLSDEELDKLLNQTE